MLDKPRTNPAPTYTGTTPLSSGTGRVVPLQLGRKIISKLFTELEKKLKFSPDLSLTNQQDSQGKAQLEAVEQLRIRSFLMPQVELTQTWRLISSLCQLHTQFSHTTFTVGSLNSSEQKRRDPFPSRAVICARTSWAGLQGELGIFGDFWGFLGISMLWEHTCVQQRRIPSPRTEE